jgi:hypothetical protein
MSEARHDPAAFPRSTVIAVLAATTVAQVACVMGIAVFTYGALSIVPAVAVAAFGRCAAAAKRGVALP